jgi:hypothetical protein
MSKAKTASIPIGSMAKTEAQSKNAATAQREKMGLTSSAPASAKPAAAPCTTVLQAKCAGYKTECIPCWPDQKCLPK